MEPRLSSGGNQKEKDQLRLVASPSGSTAWQLVFIKLSVLDELTGCPQKQQIWKQEAGDTKPSAGWRPDSQDGSSRHWMEANTNSNTSAKHSSVCQDDVCAHAVYYLLNKMIREHEYFVFVALNCEDGRKISCLIYSCFLCSGRGSVSGKKAADFGAVSCTERAELEAVWGTERGGWVQRYWQQKPHHAGQLRGWGAGQNGELYGLSSRPPGGWLLDVGWSLTRLHLNPNLAE